MLDICSKFALKINKNINNIYFLYNGKLLNLESKYKEIISIIDDNINEMSF